MSLWVSIYCLLTMWLWIGWHKAKKVDSLDSLATDLIENTPKVSVIIPVRNEAQNISLLLNDLVLQSVSCNFFEVIIINDHSEDGTVAQVKAFQEKHLLQLELLHLPSDKALASPKKAAITMGIAKARGELIMSTDGDCRVLPHWIQTFWLFYQAYQPKFISAGVTFHADNKLFSQLQSIEFASLVGSGAATLNWGIATMANGANLAYPKKVFEEVGGFEGFTQLASGDDEFLMHKIAQKYPKQALFLKHQSALVLTQAQESLSKFYAQRKRWGSKWKYYKDWRPKLLAFFIFALHLSLIIAVCLTFLGRYTAKLLVLQLGAKFLVEFGYLFTVLIFLKKQRLVKLILPLQLFYPFYVVILGLAAQGKSYTWKGRKLE